MCKISKKLVGNWAPRREKNRARSLEQFFCWHFGIQDLVVLLSDKTKTTHVNKQTMDNTPLKQNEPPIIMHRLTSVCIEEILSLIDSDKSAREICSITGIGLTTVGGNLGRYTN